MIVRIVKQPSLSGTADNSDTLGSANGTLSVKAYSESHPFGLPLPSPFNPCTSTGSHLTRLSGLRLRHTSLAHSLCAYSVYILNSTARFLVCQGYTRGPNSLIPTVSLYTKHRFHSLQSISYPQLKLSVKRCRRSPKSHHR